jgi:hypothetical protein
VSLLERCHKVTGRSYPPGYGFALGYLSDTLNYAHLRDGANRIVAAVFTNGREFAIDRRHPELVRYVNAYAESESAEGYLIEAAQLVLAEAMAGDPQAREVMKLCGHPGY